MAATAAPYGFRPVNHLGGTPYAGAIREIPLTTNNTNAFFNGQPVNITAGVPTAIITTSPTTTANAQTPVGIFVGCRYVDSTGRQFYQQFLPAGIITAGATNVFVQVVDDPDAIFQIQATGSVTASSVGLNAPLTYTAGSTFTGNSKWALTAASIAATSTLAVRIVGLVDNGGTSQPGDAFTDCLVVWNVGVHAYRNGTGQ